MGLSILKANVWRTFLFGILMTGGVSGQRANAQTASVQFDMPAIVTAEDASLPGAELREVTVDLGLSTLLVSTAETDDRPIDHLLVRIAMRDRQSVTSYLPKTELQTDYAGPISITNKHEATDSFGVSADSVVHTLGAGHVGLDEQDKTSDSKQFQQHAPMQAVVASGTTDRGRGVYYKLRWTAQQVLEGERRFRVTFAVPAAWRGGLLDVDVSARRSEPQLFGDSKMRLVASSNFVIAVCQENDPQAAELALRLSSLDQRLAVLAKSRQRDANPVKEFWKRVLPLDQANTHTAHWYSLVTSQVADPYTDKRIKTLPMPVRVAVLDYTDTIRELNQLGGEAELDQG